MNNLKTVGVSPRWLKILLSGVVIASLLAGCRLPWQAGLQTPQASEEEVKTTLRPTAEPRHDLLPALVEVFPVPDSVIGLNQPISLYFNQPMDKESVEAAIHFEPRVSGRFTWENNQLVTFMPDQALSQGIDLHLTLDTSAQATNKKSLQEPLSLHFKTADSLRVVQSVPEDGTQEVDPESVVFVSFNQPVVALGGERDAEPAFTLSPQVAGQGEWLNTSTYIFTPEPSLAGGAVYTVNLNQSLTAGSGSTFSESQVPQISFTTAVPRVLTIYPLENESLRLDGPIEVQFNIRMDPDSFAENFSLRENQGKRIAGEFEWQDDWKKVLFTPQTNLKRSTVYTLRISQKAQSFGGLPLENDLERRWTTYPAFSASPTISPEFQTYYGEFGEYRIPFNVPIASDGYAEHLTVSPDVHAKNYYLADNGQNLFLTGYFKPETRFTVIVDAALEDIWGGKLNEAITYSFTTPPAEPSLGVVTGQYRHDLVFVPAKSSELTIQATNINTITSAIAPIPIGDLITLLHPDNYSYREVYLPENLEVSTRNITIPRNTNQVMNLPLSYQGESLTPGAYFLRISSTDIPADRMQNEQKHFLIVSENNLVMKIAPDQTTVWATRLADFSPLAEVPISVYNTEGDIIAQGRTDPDGLYASELERFDEPYTNFFTITGTPGQDDFGFSISTWGQGYALYEMGILQDTLPALTQAYIYTDRPIYRPGDTVNFKAVVFSRDNGIPAPPRLNSVSVSVYGDPGMAGIPAELYSETLTLNRFGTVADAVTIPEDAPTGMYRIEIAQDETPIRNLYFDVAAYRKPEIDLSGGFDKNEIIAGEAVSAEFQAKYYFGLAASELPLTWTLYREDRYFDLAGYQVGPLTPGWLLPRTFGSSPLGAFVASGEGKTDAGGQYSLNLTADDLGMDDVPLGSLQAFTLEITLRDESGFTVSFRDSVLVHPEAFYIGIKPDSYFGRAETSFDFSLQTVDWVQEAVRDTSLTATFDAIEWLVEETGNPEEPYRYVPETTLIASASPVTDSKGQARLSFTPPEPGTYQLTVTSGDAVTQVLVWVAGSGGAVWPRQTQSRITLTPDSDEYQVGQTAQIFFPNPFAGSAKALVTTERGRVMETSLIEIEGAGHTIQIPITEETIPNIYVSVMLLGFNEKGRPDYRQGIINLPVNPVDKTLNVALTLDPAVSAPGDFVSAILTITDQADQPVQGEFSVAVVDKALLALVEPNSPPILEAIYPEQPLSVQTSISLKTYAMQQALDTMEDGRGGGDGEEQPTLREEFPDTAFWQANLITGADGTARLSIPMPDSLTTWVVSVRGLTEDYQVGETEAEILTQKDLMIRPVTPRFLVDGDHVEMAALVHNNHSEPLEVDVSLHSVGFTLDDRLDQSQHVTIEPGDRARVSWWGTVDSVATVELVFQAVSSALSDASAPIWGDLEVLRYAMPATFSTAGQLSQEGERLELVSLPISSDPSSGSLTLDLNPSLLATLVEGLEGIEMTPYDDTVSTLSRLLANLNAYLALSRLDVISDPLETNLLGLIDDGLYQLLDSQNIDGGWSWWRSSGVNQASSSDPFITAYVLLGLEQARRVGLDFSAYAMDRAVEYLSTQLVEPGQIDTAWQLDRLMFQVYALRNDLFDLTPYVEGLYARRSELTPMGMALLGLTLRDFEGASSRVTTVLADLESSAVRSATGVHWESDRKSWMLPGTPIFNTAVAVYSLSQLDPASTSLPLALQYLMRFQNASGIWASTFESAWVLMAMTEAMQGTGDYQADFEFQATLNGTLIAEGSAGSPASLSSVTATTGIDTLYPDAPNALQIERGAGAGTLYYRVDLQTFQPAGAARAINRGIELTRQYYLHGEGCPGAEGCTPIQSLALDPENPAQMITVALNMVLSQDTYHLMLEDFIPAGTEIRNKNFLTAQSLPEISVPSFDPRKPFENGWGWWYFKEPQIADDHILWTADYLPAGTYTLIYELLPYQRGTYQVLPSHAWQFFYPEVQGTSAGKIFTIE